MSETRSPYDDKTIAEIVHDYAVVRGDLTEQYARDQLVQIVERRIAEKDAEIEHERRAVRLMERLLTEARAALADVTRERDDLRARVDRVIGLAKVQAIACRAQHRADHERNWLDVLALLDTTPAEEE